jgi:CBS domain-containing protein
LTLPVCEDDGTVIGIVDVMDVIYGCGGAEGWRSIFSSSLELDDLSETTSVHSERAGTVITSKLGSTKSAKKQLKDERTVAMLRPKKPIISVSSDSISSVCKLLASKRADAAIIVDESGVLSGIITDTGMFNLDLPFSFVGQFLTRYLSFFPDITRRVVAKHVDPQNTLIEEVMTPNPKCVSKSDVAMEAMMIMIENHFRHLPTVDDEGAVMGLLDIAKCLNDAIGKLENVHSKSNDSTKKILNQALQGSGNGAALQALLGPLLSQSLGNQSTPSLRSLLTGRPSTIVTPESSVLSAGLLMAETRKAALVVEDGHLVGIFEFKDMLTRVIANDLDVEATCVSEVMTEEPEVISPDINVLEALQVMHEEKLLTLPVCEDDGTVVGVVDVMDVIFACGGAEGWKSVFDSSLDLVDDSVTESQSGKSRSAYAASVSVSKKKDLVIKVAENAPMVMSPLPSNIPTTLEFAEDYRPDFDGDLTLLSDTRSYGQLQFKIVDPSGHTHRVRSENKLSSLLDSFAEKVKVSKKNIQFKFVDDEGDAILITSDDDLIEAIKLTRSHGGSSRNLVKLTAIESTAAVDATILAGVAAGVAVLGLVALTLLKK